MHLIVRTEAGPVAGRLSDGVRSWRGVPYAAAERFGPAGPPASWTQPRTATGPGPVAVQTTPTGELVGTEDCLTLDVYAPADADGPLPVLFWVHGGAFLTGAAADYDAATLAAAGPVVVVAVSYRLGAFGFLQLGTAERPEPSSAMTDLVAALDWVQREIGRFGGDPGRLCLVGQSAGASLVCALLATAAGRRARSAIALSVGGPPQDPAESADVAGRLLAELGVGRTDLAALRALPVATVLDAATTVSRASGTVGGAVWGPVADGRVLLARPADVVASGALRGTALWFGSCRDEMAMFLRAGPDVAVGAARARTGGAAFDRLLAVYTATAAPGEDPVQALLTDEMWVRPVVRMAEDQAAAGGRVWLSRFDHTPGLPSFAGLGPSHGADNACLWARPPRFVARPLLDRPAADMGPDDLRVTAALQRSVLAMVRTGSPAAGELGDWPTYEPGRRCTAVFAAATRVVADPAAVRRRAWQSVDAAVTR